MSRLTFQPLCLSGYYRRVLIIFHKNDALDLLLTAGGVRYAVQRLTANTSQDGTDENRQIVEYILQHADAKSHEDERALFHVANYALQWKDVDAWKRAVEQACTDMGIGVFERYKILEACRTFSFEPVRPM